MSSKKEGISIVTGRLEFPLLNSRFFVLSEILSELQNDHIIGYIPYKEYRISISIIGVISQDIISFIFLNIVCNLLLNFV